MNDVSQLILDTLDQMHQVCLGIALIIILLSVYRNYTQFGENLGVRYVAGVMFSILLIALFPLTAEYLFQAMLRWGRQTGEQVEAVMNVLLNVEAEGSWLDSVAVAIASFFYKGAITLGGFFRDLMILVCGGLFLILKTLSPIFIAMLTVPETKSVSVNFLLMTFGFIMTPLCLVFGDLTSVWVAAQVWEHTGMAAAAAAASGGGGTLMALAASPPGTVAVAAGCLGALVSFALSYVFLCIVMYIGIPWSCISLFRGGGIGNALAMSLNTTANAMSATVGNMKSGGRFGTAAAKSIDEKFHRQNAAGKNEACNWADNAK